MKPKPESVAPCGQCWIEIELLDDDDVGVAHEPYWVKLQNGAMREGRLDENGFVRIDSIPCGTCMVRFPRTDGPTIRQEAARNPDVHWLEVRLLDVDDVPLANEPYVVTLADGSERSGKLDNKGKARLEGVSAGSCSVRFPAIDRADFAAPRA